MRVLWEDLINVFSVFDPVENDLISCLYFTTNPVGSYPYSIIVLVALYLFKIDFVRYVV